MACSLGGLRRKQCAVRNLSWVTKAVSRFLESAAVNRIQWESLLPVCSRPSMPRSSVHIVSRSRCARNVSPCSSHTKRGRSKANLFFMILDCLHNPDLCGSRGSFYSPAQEGFEVLTRDPRAPRQPRRSTGICRVRRSCATSSFPVQPCRCRQARRWKCVGLTAS